METQLVRGWRWSKRRHLLALPLVAAMTVASFVTAAPATATPTCASSGPGTYTATVCITDPATGSTVSGLPTVSATVDATAGNPGVQRLVFSLAGSYLLTDFAAPYTFILPTTKFADGTRTLSVQALMRDGFTTAPTSISLTFSNGLRKPPVNTNTFTPRTGTPANGAPFVLAAVGDGADGSTNADAVTNLISSWQPNMLAYLGDVYEKGTSSEFYNWYGVSNVAYGRFRSITNPVIGNHEYTSNSAPGYFDYWDNVPSYYSVDMAGWHLIALNSTSQFNQTDPTSAQYQWLVQDLAAHPNQCTIVEFHHPVVNVGPEGDTPRMDAIWQLMAQDGVDIVLTGHDHDYQRWTPLGGDLQPAASGITQFVVGSGGHGIQQFVRTDTRMQVGFDTSPGAFGALRLELNQNGAAYGFVNTTGALLDSGSVHCSGAPSDTTAPSTPGGLTSTAVSSAEVDLSWSGSTDDVGVTAYDVYRDGALIATVPPEPGYADLSASPGTTYSYEVDAIDAAGNRSGRGGPVSATTPGGGAGFFNEGFESGLARWTTTGDFSVQQAQVFSGGNAAQANAPGVASWAYHDLGNDYTDLYYRSHVKIASTTGSVYLLKFRTGTGGSIAGLFLNGSKGTIAYRDDVTGKTTSSSTPLTVGPWHDVQVHLVVQGSTGSIEVWLDGAPVAALSKTDDFGTVPIRRLQLGDNSAGRTFTEYFDDVSAGTTFLSDGGPAPDVTPPTAPSGLSATAASPSEVDLSWAGSTDDVGVTGYEIFRNGTLVQTVAGTVTAWNDTGVSAMTTYTYTVDAFDAAGNRSPLSAPAVVTPPTQSGRIFTDGFESGDLSAWTALGGMTVQQQQVRSGAYAAQATSSGVAAWAYHDLGGSYTDLYYRTQFMVSSTTGNVYVLKARTASGAGAGTSILGVFVNGTNRTLQYRNDVTSTTTASKTPVTLGVWHDLQVHLVVAGASSQVAVWLDGNPVAALTKTDNLGTDPLGRLQLGDNTAGRTYTEFFDDAMVGTQFLTDAG